MCDAFQELALKIDRVDVFPLRYPTRGFFKFLTGRSAAGRAAVLVKITADEGTVGWGQSVPIESWSYETLETATVAIRDYFAPHLMGVDPLQMDQAERRMDQAIAPGFSTGMPLARAGIDLALHDLAGKLQGKTLAQMWGRSSLESITLSWTINVASLDDLEHQLSQGQQRGYHHFNIKVAPDPEFDVRLARRVREAAPHGFLWADANGGYDVETALAVAPRLADAGVDVLESPLRPNRFRGYQALKKQGALPILMDEGVVSAVELEEFVQLNMLDGVAMKPARCGGLLSNRRQIELIERHGLMWLGSGLMDPDLALAASLGLYGAYGLDRPAALNGPQFLTASVLTQPLDIRGDRAYLPTAPGLGVSVDPEKVTSLGVPVSLGVSNVL